MTGPLPCFPASFLEPLLDGPFRFDFRSLLSGVSLNSGFSSVLQINPDLPQSHELRGWYDSEGSTLTTSSLTQARTGGGGDVGEVLVAAVLLLQPAIMSGGDHTVASDELHHFVQCSC